MQSPHALLCSALLCSALFCSVCCSVLFAVLFCSVLLCSVLFCCVMSIGRAGRVVGVDRAGRIMSIGRVIVFYIGVGRAARDMDIGGADRVMDIGRAGRVMDIGRTGRRFRHPPDATPPPPPNSIAGIGIQNSELFAGTSRGVVGEDSAAILLFGHLRCCDFNHQHVLVVEVTAAAVPGNEHCGAGIVNAANMADCRNNVLHISPTDHLLRKRYQMELRRLSRCCLTRGNTDFERRRGKYGVECSRPQKK
eukprot:gene9733-biopygen191